MGIRTEIQVRWKSAKSNAFKIINASLSKLNVIKQVDINSRYKEILNSAV